VGINDNHQPANAGGRAVVAKVVDTMKLPRGVAAVARFRGLEFFF
jgi:hypothetical protein